MVRLFTQDPGGRQRQIYRNGPDDRGSIPSRVIPKTQKLYLMPSCLTHGIIRYGSRVSWVIRGKELSLFLHLSIAAIEKRAFGSLLTSVSQLIYIYIYTYIYIYIYSTRACVCIYVSVFFSIYMCFLVLLVGGRCYGVFWPFPHYQKHYYIFKFLTSTNIPHPTLLAANRRNLILFTYDTFAS